MSSTRSWLGAVGAALVMAAPMSAQQAIPTDAGVAPAVSAVQAPAPSTLLRPTSEGAALVYRADAATAPAASLMPVRAQGAQSTNVALMIVGGAALVVGSLIDGDTGTIVMVGGGVVGLLGLFRYLR